MKNITKRELIMIIVLLIVIVIAAYYNFFLKENLSKRSSLDIEIADVNSALRSAKLKNTAIDQTQIRIDEIKVEIESFKDFILPGLDRPQIIRLLDRSVYPFITDSVITFSSGYRDLGSNHIYVIMLSFNTQQENFTRILENLKNETILNRVVNSSTVIVDPDNNILSVRIEIEILTQNNPMVSFKTDNIPVEE